MPLLLHIETTTKACSVGLSRDGQMAALRESVDKDYAHSNLLTVYIEELFAAAGVTPDQLDAVAVSSGPGSYTGLRIGVSAAKGLCYALDIPLIAVNTMRALAVVARNRITTCKGYLSPNSLELLYCPMIDARRMEVYYALFDSKHRPIKETGAAIIDENSFKKQLESKKIIFFGDGAEKCRPLIQSKNALFLKDVWPSAKGMIQEAESKWEQKDFVNLAYFEPYYLKDFVAGKPKVKGLH